MKKQQKFNVELVNGGRVADIDFLVANIHEATKRSRGSELKLQSECDGHLRETLKNFGIDYDPQVNQSLRRSYASSGRPDSLFGRVVLDYKAPGVLQKTSGLKSAKRQVVDDYLRSISTVQGVFDPDEASKLVGVLLDGQSITFARFDGFDWIWTPLHPVNQYTLATLVQYYRSLYRKPLDPRLLSNDFGRNTQVATNCIRVFADYLMHPTTRTSMFFKEWKRMFAQVSTYELNQLPSLAAWAEELNLPCKDDPALLLYCLHTYYALIVKLLTAELVTASRHFPLESFFEKLVHAQNNKEFYREIERLELGDVFRDLGITNFLEGDFFLWYLPHYNKELETALRQVVDVFLTYEPATPKLNPARCKDLLKVFYSGVVDEQLRHDLGEYYTPDWLAELVLDRVGYDGNINAKVLDPACGSGTFLVLAMQRFTQAALRKGLSPSEIIDRLRTQFKGFDLNPLAVISARANFLLSISENLRDYGADIEIPVYLCDCINIPQQKDVEGTPCLIYPLETEFGQQQIALPQSLIDKGFIGRILLYAEQAIKDHASSEKFLRTLLSNPEFVTSIGSGEVFILTQFYKIIEELEEKDWDQIWCRIIKNHFASQAIADFNYIVGNPPWVRWSRLPVSYRQRCKQFCNYYGLVSGRGYAGGIETDISTVVTYSSVDNWLKTGGMIGFLITATVYKSDSATGFRLFELPNKIPIFPKSIDDLVALQPFPDANNETSLFVARKGSKGEDTKKIYPPAGIPYRVWKGSRPETWLPLERITQATQQTELRAIPIAERGSPLYTGSPNDVEAIQLFKGNSPYLEQSHKGTMTDMSRVYWVKVLSYDRVHNLAMIRTLTEEEFGRARSDGIKTTKGMWLEADLLYPLMRGRDVDKFSHHTDGWHILIPNTHYDDVVSESDFSGQYPKAYSYLKRNKDVLRERSTYKRYQRHLPFYVIYDVGSYTFSKFKVVWPEQQNPGKFRACVISEDPTNLLPNKMIVADHKLYMLSTDDEDEAHFVCSVLNSTPLRRMLGGFLVGKQIGTSIFRYVGIPVFDVSNQDHKEIAAISKAAHNQQRELNSTTQEQLDELIMQIFTKKAGKKTSRIL